MAQVDEKSMVPTILVGVGGTGAEVLSRVRRLIEESYGDLKNFPIISFLVVDTDKDYKITDPEASGTQFKDQEKYWAKVGGREVSAMINNMEGNYPWISRWFPTELERNITSLEAGAGQIRACGRFAFFCNYHGIQQQFLSSSKRIKGHESYMLDRYNINVSTNSVNVFLTGSLSGGTGSGMLIDMGYCIRKWLQSEGSPTVTAIVPMPQAFAGISVGDRVLANGYAAMMELSYFSDHRTEYAEQFSSGLVDEVRSPKPPFDFTYLVGTKNTETEFKLSQIREMIAQNIFLDLTSEFAPHKRSIRDNIKASWAQADPGGRGYPKNFMSFGLSTIEIPIAQMRTSLSNRLGQDLVSWWLNENAPLPADMLELVRGDILKRMRLNEMEIIADLSAAQDRPYPAVISEWVNSIRSEITQENWLQCTQQQVNIIGSEKGKILGFVSQYLEPKVNAYRADHFREISPDERSHGDYFTKMYDNRDKLIIRGREALEAEFYTILQDRTRGVRFAYDFVEKVRQIFKNASERFRREQDQVWTKNEESRQNQYQDAIKEINEYKDKFGITKQDKMEKYAETALSGLEGSFNATIQRKSRTLGLTVIQRLEEHLAKLEKRLNSFNQRLRIARDYFKEVSDRQAESADALVINGIKLYDRQELNGLYQDLIEQLAGASQGSQTTYEIGMNQICSTMSEDVLRKASPLWDETRSADRVMALFDITRIPDVREEDFREVILERTQTVILNAPGSSRLKQELSACDRVFKVYNDESEITNNIRIAYNKSQPIIVLNKAVLNSKDAGFTPARNTNVALLGGVHTSNPAAQKLLPKIKEFIGNEDDIKPLGDLERHRIVFVQEIGGFSLRCIDGMQELRQSYRDWKGEFITAKRAQLRGESRDLPIPVHLQKEPPFWDIFPEDPQVFKLIVQARALDVLRQDTNTSTRESVIRYTRQNTIEAENVDLASSWEETSQVLEVKACREDREEIQRQVEEKYTNAETDAEKQALYNQLVKYLKQRSEELQGGKDSPDYRRDRAIIQEVVRTYQLKVQTPTSPKVVNTDNAKVNTATKTDVFCTNCGQQNPASSKFCSKCGTSLTK